MDFQICAVTSAALTFAATQLAALPTADAPRVFFAIFFLAYALLKVYRLFVYPFWISPLRHLPGPKDGHWLLGKMLHQMRTKGPNDMFLDMAMRWPDEHMIRYLSLGNEEILFVNSLQAHKEVQQIHAYAFAKSPIAARMFSRISGMGLLFAEGDEHRRQRMQMNKAFSVTNLKKLIPVFQGKAIELSDTLRREMGEQKSATITVEPIFQKATLDVLVISTLGVDPESLTSEEATFHALYERIIHQSAAGHLITFLDAHFPIRSWLPLAINRRWLKANDEIRRLLLDEVRKRLADFYTRDRLSLPTREARDVLTFVIEEEPLSKNQKQWSDTQLLDYLLNFIAGGHETMATSLTWAAHSLAIGQDIQDRLRQELDALYSQHPEGWQPEFSDIEKLNYLNNYFRELLRFYSPALFLPRIAVHDVTVCNIRIPKGTTMMYCPAATHFNPSIWGDDARSFNPDRWDTDRGPANSPYAYEPFLQGPRNCIGRMFAILNIKVAIIDMVRSFRILPADGAGEMVYSNPNFTLRPKELLRVKLEQLN